jgi:elongation factor P
MKQFQELRTGNIIKLNGVMHLIVKYEYVKAARSNAVVKAKLKNMNTGSISESVYKADEKVEDIRLEKRPMQFLFKANDVFTFMDQQTFEQHEINEETLGNARYFIKEDDVIDVLCHEERPITLDLPNAMELKITYTENGIRGDSSGRVLKPATLETGMEIQVPLFCNIGDVIRVDTRSGEYLERAK